MTGIVNQNQNSLSVSVTRFHFDRRPGQLINFRHSRDCSNLDITFGHLNGREKRGSLIQRFHSDFHGPLFIKDAVLIT
jgi:hypothetical protein